MKHWHLTFLECTWLRMSVLFEFAIVVCVYCHINRYFSLSSLPVADGKPCATSCCWQARKYSHASPEETGPHEKSWTSVCACQCHEHRYVRSILRTVFLSWRMRKRMFCFAVRTNDIFLESIARTEIILISMYNNIFCRNWKCCCQCATFRR